MSPFLHRVVSGQQPLTVGLLTFVTTLALILAQPGVGVA